MAGICPKCGKGLPYVNGEIIDIKSPSFGKSIPGVSYSCPSCNCVLSVQMDPLMMQSVGKK
jgi:hypothetical protein